MKNECFLVVVQYEVKNTGKHIHIKFAGHKVTVPRTASIASWHALFLVVVGLT